MSKTKQSKIATEALSVPPASGGMTVESAQRDGAGAPRGFFRGEHLTLRPVLKGDLSGLAEMLAEDPLPWQPGPWTLARLEKMFDDKKSPGLWSAKGYRYFIALGPTGGVCGYVYEQDRGAGVYSVQHWLGAGHPQRRAAGIELVTLHTRWLTDWHAARLVETRSLADSGEQAAWLTACGFELSCETPPHAWHMGALRPLHHYSWFSAELRTMPPHSTGEPESSAAVEAVLDW